MLTQTVGQSTRAAQSGIRKIGDLGSHQKLLILQPTWMTWGASPVALEERLATPHGR
jgi:hypothetical protein